MTHGSLFAGIGGFDLGLERAGFTSVWQVEQNEYCQRVLAKNFPEAKGFGDIRECGAHNLERVDIISGGFPCQDISNAGLRAGIEGERSGLWGEYARIIGELRPRYVLVENVAALLGRGMGRVLGDLAALGYDAEWQVISAADMGAPQLRERVWILAYAGHAWIYRGGRDSDACKEVRFVFPDGCDGLSRKQQLQEEILADAARILEGRQEQRPQRERTGPRGEPILTEGQRCGAGRTLRSVSDDPGQSEQPQLTADAISEELEGYSRHGVDGNGWERSDRSVGSPRVFGGERAAGQWLVEPDVGRVAHGIPARVDRLKGLGNAIVPQIAEWIGRKILAYEAEGVR